MFLDPAGSYIQDPNGKTLPLEEKGGMYVLSMWVSKDQRCSF